MTSSQDGVWDSFWRGTSEKAAYDQHGPLERVLAQFWTKFFIEQMATYAQPRFLDLACGNGIVTQFMHDAMGHLGERPYSIQCVDFSHAAIASLSTRFPSVNGVIADAKHTPFADMSFDIVVSQFGIEYAGIEGFAEAARLVGKKGTLATIIHLKDGAIYQENLSNHRAIIAIQQSNVLDLFCEFATAFYSIRANRGRSEQVQQADKKLAIAVTKLEQVLNTFGLNVASGAAYALHSDLAQMYARLAAYRLEDIHSWAAHNSAELQHYAGRMSSMLDAAVDAQGIAAVIRETARRRLSVSRSEGLMVGKASLPTAWLLTCKQN